ncbi:MULTISPECIES: hypothetical protein [unclassified Streptomyces]|uniref:hypothetical protein n=1 Tax=unclassified Streptomyces TaxID=2593676 RepID=UPI001C229620|nr:hypothetical protein [Streptomyces sp. AC558_RSS880]
MYMQGRRLRLTAVSVMVVLALTGFSSGRDQGNSSQDSSGEGGCSSSSQDHDGSTPGGSDPLGSSSSSPSGDSYDSGTSNTSGGGSQPTPTVSPSSSPAPPLKDGTAVLVRCASMEDPYATVEIRNPNGRDAVLNVKVSFADKHGYTLLDTGSQISVPAKGKTTYRVPAKMRYTDKIAQCEVDPVATAVW